MTCNCLTADETIAPRHRDCEESPPLCYAPRRWSRRDSASTISSERRNRSRRPKRWQGIVPLAAALRSAASVIPRRSAASGASRRRSAKDAFAISSRTMARISCKTEATRRGLERTRAITASTTMLKAWSSCSPDETRRSCGTARGEGEDCRKRIRPILERSSQESKRI